MICNNCNNHVKDNTRLCPFCGSNPYLSNHVEDNNKPHVRTTFNGLGPTMSDSNATPGGFGKNFGLDVAAKNKLEKMYNGSNKKSALLTLIFIIVIIAIIMVLSLLLL